MPLRLDRALLRPFGKCMHIPYDIRSDSMYRQNSPDVITYAACANEVLRDCIRHRDFNERGSKDTNVLQHAPLPISGHFDAVVAGFPW
jgi:hypothetical protein